MADRSLSGKTVLITGATRGIGKAIGLRAAQDGANVAVLGKTVDPHPKLQGTIHEAAAEMAEAGGRGLAVECDIRFEDQAESAVENVISEFGGIDVLVNNASAIFLSGTLQTPMKRFDLMHQVNTRGTFLMSQLCVPHLVKSETPHVLMISPPAEMEPGWFSPTLAYTMAKYGMSLCVQGLSREFAQQGVAVNALWPKTGIATAAIGNLLGGEAALARCRKPEIVSDAAWEILTRRSRACTGQFFIDEDVLREAGIADFEPYAVSPGAPLMPDFFLGEPDIDKLRLMLHG